MRLTFLPLAVLGALVAAQNETLNNGPFKPATTASPPPSTVSSGEAATAGAPVSYPTLAPDAGPSLPNTAPLPVLPTDMVFFSVPNGTSKPTVPVHGAWFSYSQAPIPATTTTLNPATFTAAFTNKDIAAPPTTREYDFTLHYAAGWPSGYLRRMAVINNQFPGPLIEANIGDTIVVHVHNNLDIPQAIHWHGIRQNGSNAMDGVPGFSQCAIQPGKSFTYRFQVPTETGTFWYHSHYGNTLADGLVGGLIVHSRDDPLKLGVDYDDDRVLYLSDWMNDQSDVIIHEETDMRKPYRGINFVAQPDAALINGVGQCDCSWAQRGVPCGINPHAEVVAAKGDRVRLRLINHGGQALIRFSIDGHSMTVIEADDTAVEPVTVNEVPVGSGQRYSVVVTLNKGEVGASFWIRAHVGTWCINPASKVNGVGILRYSNKNGKCNGKKCTSIPDTQPHPDLKDPQHELCRDLDEYVPLVPRVREDAPAEASQSFAFNSLFGIFTDPVRQTPMVGFGMNGQMYKNMIK
jgi:FtsP/CotA-like multicopper oxidase with cupredoxin domain